MKNLPEGILIEPLEQLLQDWIDSFAILVAIERERIKYANLGNLDQHSMELEDRTEKAVAKFLELRSKMFQEIIVTNSINHLNAKVMMTISQTPDLKQ